MNYERMANTADRLIASFGEAAILRKVSITVPDPSQPFILGVPQTTDVACRAVWLDEVQKDRAGELAPTSSQTVYLSPLTPAEPAKQDLIVRGGQTWAIENVHPIRPAGVVVLYELQVAARG